MTRPGHTSAFPRHDAPEFFDCPCPRMQRARGMPGARPAPMAPCTKAKSTRALLTTGSADQSGIPRAAGFNGFLRTLPGDRAFLPPSPADHHPQTWRQRRGVRTTRLHRPQHCRSSFDKRCVHRIPRPTFSDDRETPLLKSAGRRCHEVCLPREGSKIFFARSTGQPSKSISVPKTRSIAEQLLRPPSGGSAIDDDGGDSVRNIPSNTRVFLDLTPTLPARDEDPEKDA